MDRIGPRTLPLPALTTQHHRIALFREIVAIDDLPLMQRIAAALSLAHCRLL
ncbi:hypothetical protein [Streptomyces sp. NPDC052107]|uniref:hypothetical protein n=1 Tax=Streptomyces sp. NPDC052107 TaxID=3155632 RepID=UPI0034398013